ncbi:hypothetical protein WG66_003873 [Moniliophthora roreri]|nr:hypothetical protein WG66_003873 [Moniliophthora roreri]
MIQRIVDLMTRRFVDVPTLGPHHVICLACNQRISLHPDMRYNLTNWVSHAEACNNVQGGTSSTMKTKDRLKLLKETDLDQLSQEYHQHRGLHNPKYKEVALILEQYRIQLVMEIEARRRQNEKPEYYPPLSMAFATHAATQGTPTGTSLSGRVARGVRELRHLF